MDAPIQKQKHNKTCKELVYIGVYRSRSYKIVSNSRTRRMPCEAFIVTKYRFNRVINITCTVHSIYMLKENIYSQLYYTKLLNECNFQHTSNVAKVKEKDLNTCIII